MTSLSQLLPGSADGGRLMFRRRNGDITLSQFRRDAACLVSRLLATGKKRVVLHADDLYAFSVGLLSCMHAGVSVVLPPDAAQGTLATLCTEDAVLVSDPPLPGALPVLCEETPADLPVEKLLQPFDAQKAPIIFYTSGSSGKPKVLNRSFANLEAEVVAVRVFHSDKQPHIFSTVSPMHAYGIIFSCLMPLTRGWVIECMPTSGLEGVLTAVNACESPTWLVSSPAFLKLWMANADLFSLPKPPEALLSAGAPLPTEVAAFLADRYSLVIHEVFGSTETGVIANRNRAGDPWLPFPGVRVESCEQGVRIYSPAVGEELGGSCILGDAIETLPGGYFRLLGRIDRIVKIADKRLSLAEVESRLREHPMVQDATATVLSGGRRPRLAVAVTLEDGGLEILATEGYAGCISRLREHLSKHFDPVLLPRRWRFVGDIPLNTQSKVDRAALQALLEEPWLAPWYKITSRTETELDMRLLFIKDTPCFAGHFPGYPIVPGVLFLHTISYTSERYLNKRVTGVQRCKFCAEVHPGEWCRMHISVGEDTASFTCVMEGAGKCSTGRLKVGSVK